MGRPSWSLLCHLPLDLLDGEAPEAQMLRTLRQDVQSCEGEFQAASKAEESTVWSNPHKQNMAAQCPEKLLRPVETWHLIEFCLFFLSFLFPIRSILSGKICGKTLAPVFTSDAMKLNCTVLPASSHLSTSFNIFQHLSTSFNHLSQALKSAMAELQAQRQKVGTATIESARPCGWAVGQLSSPRSQ